MPQDFLTGAPFRGLDAETLAKLAHANFRPPGLMNAPGMAAMGGLGGSPPPGLNVRELTDGAGKLAVGLAKVLDPPLGGDGTRTGRDADLGGYSAVRPGDMVNLGGGDFRPNPNGMQFGMGGVPLGTSAGAAPGLSMPDFLSPAWRSITGLFASGGSAGTGFFGGGSSGFGGS